MDECNACNSISGVYYALCDDCMTKLNQLQADHQRLSRLLSASESRESVLRDENARLKEAFALIDIDDLKGWSCASCPRFSEVKQPKYECGFDDCFVNWLEKTRYEHKADIVKLREALQHIAEFEADHTVTDAIAVAKVALRELEGE